MPDARELERALRSVIPEMVADGAFVGELVADRLQVLPPSLDAGSWPNQLLDCDA
jgi:hypothetical protein